MTDPPSFELHDVAAGPPDAPILRSVTLELPGRGVTALAGPSGAGKSSLLRLLNRLADPITGRVEYRRRALVDWEPTELRRHVAMVFQRPPVFPGTVLDNLRVARAGLDDRAAAAALARVGLGDSLIDRIATDLSGGEAQRMCLARALLTQPTVLLADEPTASLDAASQRTIENLVRGLTDDGMPVIWVSHDIDQLRRLCDHVVVLAGGRVVANGPVGELDRHPDAIVRESVGAA